MKELFELPEVMMRAWDERRDWRVEAWEERKRENWLLR